MDFEEGLLVEAGGTVREQRRGSTSSLPTPQRVQKLMVDLRELHLRPASAPPCNLNYETDYESDKGVMYLEEYKEQVMQHVDDGGSFFEEVMHWTPGMLMDMDLEPEDIQIISSSDSDDVVVISDSEGEIY